MARRGATPRGRDTVATVSGASLEFENRAGGGTSGGASPSDEPESVFVQCYEKIGIRGKRAPTQTLLYVDVNGVSFIDGETLKCISRHGFNTLTSWCALDDCTFELKALSVEHRKLESRRFETPPGVAEAIAQIMQTFVAKYVERPSDIKRMRQNAATFQPGETVEAETLQNAHALGEEYRRSHQTEKVESSSRMTEINISSRRNGNAKVRVAMPGERLQRAGARRGVSTNVHDGRGEHTKDTFLSDTSLPSSPESESNSFSDLVNGRPDVNSSFVNGAGLDDTSLRAAYDRREASYAALKAEEEAAWAKHTGGRQNNKQDSDDEENDASTSEDETAFRGFSFGDGDIGDAGVSPSPPSTDDPSAFGFTERARHREIVRQRQRTIDASSRPEPALFDTTLAQPEKIKEQDDPEEWLGGGDYFYDDDDDDGDAGDNIRPSTRKTTTAQSNSNFIPVPVSPRTPGALARTPSAKRGGGGAKNGANTTDVNATHSNLNRRVRGFAGLLRDSLGRAGRVSSERDMKSECLKLVDRLRRFVAEGDAEDDGFAG